MTPSISHNREEETPEAKARWFQSLTPQERVDVFSEFMDMIYALRPELRSPRVTGWKAMKARILSLQAS